MEVPVRLTKEKAQQYIVESSSEEVIAKPAEQETEAGREQVKVLLAYDTSNESKAAATWAARLASAEAGSTIHVVGVVQTLEMAPGTRDAVDPTVHPEALEKALGDATEQLKRDASGVEVRASLLTGNPAEQIIDAARDDDVIVMGKSGSHGMRRFLIGTVAERVARHSDTPVLIVQ